MVCGPVAGPCGGCQIRRLYASLDWPTSPRAAQMRAWMGRAAQVRVTVTRVAGDGSVRRAVVDTVGRDDAARWEELIEQAGLGVPPPYRPRPGEAVYTSVPESWRSRSPRKT